MSSIQFVLDFWNFLTLQSPLVRAQLSVFSCVYWEYVFVQHLNNRCSRRRQDSPREGSTAVSEARCHNSREAGSIPQCASGERNGDDGIGDGQTAPGDQPTQQQA